MGIKNNSCNRVFVMKQYTSDLFRWVPPCNQKKIKISGNASRQALYGCTAFAGTNGQDWNTTYVYNVVVLDYQQQRIAYVACDYVM